MKFKLGLFFVCILSSFVFSLDQELTSLFNDLIKGDTVKGAKVVAVMPFKCAGKGVTEDNGRSVAEFGVVALQASGQYTLVERTELLKAVQEIQLAQTGLMSDSAGLQIGRMVSANRLVLGTVSDIFGKRMISARIVKTETGEVLSSASVTVPEKDLAQFTKKLLGEKGQVSATLFRSALVPGWGQLYTDHPVKGGIFLTVFCATAGYLAYCINAASQARNESDTYNNYLNSPEWQQDAIDTLTALQVGIDDAAIQRVAGFYKLKQDSLYQVYSDKFDNALIAGLIMGGVWALNLADAALIGVREKRDFNLYFSSTPCEPIHVQLTFRF
ncbi:MAG: hypothetical protein A2268_15515 [Candidatus Raymondbacteria bacterium RifOxyA12_full_50_37]|uniref:FlgO domain-containing protein n=1 Tax=Candidatus Raymondbacteria bacterium RIFOXYD12_FULL_49_13 TaxID=1817890 RepID=A0A1F7F3J6_UNCRA|nr:MAG: hypothetical protein A2268_15515 [Candidatus Raymondbacteria bacterium RifOxyA12_full_50_37]OGJ88439.1 MAG: hypothetical protein A2248_19750 [Candidatus Raymondbacteria bacterium RIFOXYA2_FULL_49_16]OGJ93107.1 MAG: hypothetical protein A2487_09035 [Candidatus Raymondbacteria bacterium RifOxyC12_full_50_8]OGJ98899.1 MAG: hypothetical protein A2453_10465 [Candidatus Raymondbacteria bacterium RIFOXYC2_FULL_50_21]OGK01244.1 MAG: hypothetical protein A2519_22585 [Candidatus Raymondbacteria b